MGHKFFSFTFPFLLCLYISSFVSPYPSAYSQLDYRFYDRSCPRLLNMVKYGVWAAYKNDTRIAASLLRLHFHDCFVNVGGPFWPVLLGRRDGTTASQQAANEQLPSPIEPLENITAKFTSKGLDLKDVVVLSGAHTIGFAQCFTFKRRLFNFQGTGKPDPTLDASAVSSLQSMCPDTDSSNSNLAPLDTASTYKFDNMYYTNLVNNVGLLESDQALMKDPKTAAMVNSYSAYPFLFWNDFSTSMAKLGNLGVITGKKGQIRKKCGAVNY
ncbi:heme peroxidase, plant/fungal/bacterial [Corchorus capsularis]|uniref:Heme peroxidase, plant/fungal/bacterial n=1 Tax=Corchorus capsularis TaxID=210143 RepID=A0A1R3HUU0_COCAP|nr:heme peroxidase, plant/fungal/bacterial [Corchorus capsularis]